MADERPNPIDAHVGRRIRLRRIALGWSQSQMADAIGVTYQQAHKYEKGINRIAASRLYEVASVLDVPVGYFFEDMPKEIRRMTPGRMAKEGGDEAARITADHAGMPAEATRATMELMRAFNAIADEATRTTIQALIRNVARLAGGSDIAAYFARLDQESQEGDAQ